ncbi:hypothetical protein EVAR_41378_1 [Eumeta japonica]|uniref:Uncharacterized protein n=1 Tax=Eumeta variegata TaxID=151549 RepID=A0A4C1WZR0_EUMVA|nr:hypothetical protein EVAR_41378_1 [Eumeta japonica]
MPENFMDSLHGQPSYRFFQNEGLGFGTQLSPRYKGLLDDSETNAKVKLLNNAADSLRSQKFDAMKIGSEVGTVFATGTIFIALTSDSGRDAVADFESCHSSFVSITTSFSITTFEHALNVYTVRGYDSHEAGANTMAQRLRAFFSEPEDARFDVNQSPINRCGFHSSRIKIHALCLEYHIKLPVTDDIVASVAAVVHSARLATSQHGGLEI